LKLLNAAHLRRCGAVNPIPLGRSVARSGGARAPGQRVGLSQRGVSA
jgi:hypothetical protein